MKTKWLLFFTMMKIGAFTFGGGYAMIALIRRECVERRGWIGNEEFLDLVAIAESTPGPFAINAATYIGYKTGGILGAVMATLGMCLPSFAVIWCVSLFFDAFLSLTYVGYAFRGIQVCVTYLILSAGIRMIREVKREVFSLIVLCVTIAGMITLSLLSVNFSSVFYILAAGTAGLTVYLIGLAKKGRGDQ